MKYKKHITTLFKKCQLHYKAFNGNSPIDLFINESDMKLILLITHMDDVILNATTKIFENLDCVSKLKQKYDVIITSHTDGKKLITSECVLIKQQ